MSPYRRRVAPAFWSVKEARWAEREASWASIDPLAWEHEGRKLRDWFHELCREEGEPSLCAYCEVSLKEGARETIDHFVPRSVFPELALAWHNLLPACDRCNETYKRDQWSCRLVRPDTDPVDEWFDLNMTNGSLRPSASIESPVVRARVRLTIAVLRLNTPERCAARFRLLKAMHNAWRRGAMREHDRLTVTEQAERGPYRLVARRFLDAVPPSAPMTPPPVR